jgi:hypothetical protein
MVKAPVHGRHHENRGASQRYGYGLRNGTHTTRGGHRIALHRVASRREREISSIEMPRAHKPTIAPSPAGERPCRAVGKRGSLVRRALNLHTSSHSQCLMHLPTSWDDVQGLGRSDRQLLESLTDSGELGSPGPFRLDAANDSIENSRLCLLDRCDRVVDRERCLPLQPFGMVIRAFYASIML